MIDPTGLWILFTSSFLASTLLPGGSEATLIYTAHQAIAPAALLWSIATLGNSLGGITNWVIGWLLRRRFPHRTLDKARDQKALDQLGRYGSPLLLLSWLPVIGDPLCLAAGWAGIRLLPAFLFIAIGKGIRYALLLYLLPPLT
ncbi:MAG: VTT domain-containing protein [Sedimenticola sp.]